jgi:hypothetical protein
MPKQAIGKYKSIQMSPFVVTPGKVIPLKSGHRKTNMYIDTKMVFEKQSSVHVKMQPE